MLTNAYVGRKAIIEGPTTEDTYEREDLENKKVKMNYLKAILRERHQRTTDNKKELIERVIKTCNQSCSYQQKLLKAIETNNFSSLAQPHEFYRNNFNSVDLHTRRWYNAYFAYGVRHWRAKMILSILTCGIVNVYTVLTELPNMNFKVYRRDLARILIKYKNNEIKNNH